MITDSLNKNSHIEYDYRNLITQIQHKAIVDSDTSFYLTFYSYDETGNRIAKTIYKYTSSSGPPEDTSPGGPITDDYWDLYSVEIYSRDVSGKELVIYKDNTVLEYPVYGLDMIGKIKNDEVFFYYKDHLGSVRAVVNSSGDVVSAQDYACPPWRDAWGYFLQGRTFDSDSGKFKFTSKERDSESDYDYFGARYYDSRIGRWGQTEPMLDKYPSLTPYNYSVDNPLNLFDPNGKDPKRDQLGSLNDVLSILNENIGSSYWELKNAFSNSSSRYVYTQVGGFFDLQHFFAAASISGIVGFENSLSIGEVYENLQEGSSFGSFDENSAWDPEDPPSNFWGALFGLGSDNALSLGKEDVEKFKELMNSLGILEKNDPAIARDKLYIPENSKDVKLPERKTFIYLPYRGEAPIYPLPMRYLNELKRGGIKQ